MNRFFIAPSFEVHPVGEANGDLTWFISLSDAEKQMMNRNRLEWYNYNYKIDEEEHPKHAILNHYK